ncbi:MAG: hypothetical protein JW767_02835 [Thermoleophilia bacterium]|nr:hypothetical protein [Thermoleophilia bacterium]
MSDTSGTQADTTPPALVSDAPGAGPETAETPSAGEKAPPRPAAQIRADIERERTALQGSFETLRGELDEAVDAARQRAVDAARKARVVGPVVAGGVASVAGAVLLLRRRRGGRR